MICQICKKEIKSNQALSKHIKNKHDINQQYYYDLYLKKENENICSTCGKITPFLCMSKGYQKHCCAKCAQQDPNVNNIFRNHNPQIHKTKPNNKAIFKDVDFTCKICNKHFTNNRCISNHMRMHNISIQKYWLTYQNNKCIICGKETKFIDAASGYSQYCCAKHRNLYLYGVENNPHKYDSRRIDIEQQRKEFEQQNNVISYCKALELYGQGWRAIQDNINFVTFAGLKYIPKNELYKIEEYNEIDHYRNNSKEQSLLDFISSFYKGEIITHCRKIISPLELDIYIPDLKIAIEFNGVFFHAIESGIDINYHLNKSLMCRNQNIRLIHIYEFENFDEQKQLLKDLILGQDNYPKNDFNKNNFNNKIPKPKIIYKDDRNTIYGAGKLY